MLKIIFEQVVRRLFPRRSMQSLTKSEILRAENEAIQIMNRTKGKTGEVLDLTGRRIDTSQPIIGGRNIESINNELKKALDEKKAMFPGSAKPPKGNINYPEIEKKFGFPLRGNESLSELAKIEKMGRDQYYNSLADRAMSIRTRMSKLDAEGGTEIGYQEFNKLQQELDGLNDFITRVQKEVPEDFASGGLARVGYAGGGKILKWLLSLGSKKPKYMFQIEELAIKKNIIKKDEVITKEEVFNPKTKKDTIEYNVYKKSDKNRPPTEGEIEDYMEELPHGGEMDWHDFGNTVDELDKAVADHKSYVADMFQQYKRGELEKYVKPEVLEESRLLRQKKIDKVLDKAYDEIAGGSGFSDDYKMAADQLSDSIAEQLGFGEFTNLSQMYKKDIYDTALKRVTGDLEKRLSQPTKTLEGIKKEGTIDISDPEVADEFSRFMKESDPKGYKDLEQKIQLESFDVKDRKKNASGGIAGQLHLNQGGRASFTKGGKVSSGLANILGV